MIEANNLTKKYKNSLAVNDISFKVKTGHVTGFLGPNGAGKSTTMRLMLGLDRGQGYVTYDGKRINEYSEPAKVVGMLLEAKAFHPSRSARNHLKVLADAGNIPKNRVDEVIDTVGLSSVAAKKPGKFSLGMSQRLGIAAAILGNPKYLILDEPANGLDPEGTRWLRNFLKDYASKGNAVFVSSHLLAEMSILADQIIVIGKGKIITDTTTEELLSAGSRSSVLVRARQTKDLEKALKKEKLEFTKDKDRFIVLDAKTDAIGKLAYSKNIEIRELSPQSESLEDIFLALTSEVQEYRTEKPKEG